MAANDPPRRSIIQHIWYMISQNNFEVSVCEPYLNKIDSDIIVVLKAYKTAIDDREKINNEFTRLRWCLEDRKLKIDSLEN